MQNLPESLSPKNIFWENWLPPSGFSFISLETKKLENSSPIWWFPCSNQFLIDSFPEAPPFHPPWFPKISFLPHLVFDLNSASPDCRQGKRTLWFYCIVGKINFTNIFWSFLPNLSCRVLIEFRLNGIYSYKIPLWVFTYFAEEIQPIIYDICNIFKRFFIQRCKYSTLIKLKTLGTWLKSSWFCFLRKDLILTLLISIFWIPLASQEEILRKEGTFWSNTLSYFLLDSTKSLLSLNG